MKWEEATTWKKEGLSRVLKFLQQKHLVVKTLVTDRHRQINKWLRESYPEINHYYDTWHVAKGTLYSLQINSVHVFITSVYCRLSQKTAGTWKAERLWIGHSVATKYTESPLLVSIFHT